MYIDYLANHKTLVPDVAEVLYGDLGNHSIALFRSKAVTAVARLTGGYDRESPRRSQPK